MPAAILLSPADSFIGNEKMRATSNKKGKSIKQG